MDSTDHADAAPQRMSREGRHVALSTQVRHPWRTTVRTVFQAVVALAAGLPLVVAATGGAKLAGVGTALVVAAAVTRVMSLPWTESFLQAFLPFLSAEPSPSRAARREATRAAKHTGR